MNAIELDPSIKRMAATWIIWKSTMNLVGVISCAQRFSCGNTNM
jgi:hypothetical protein